jgi:hypothetical protein
MHSNGMAARPAHTAVRGKAFTSNQVSQRTLSRPTAIAMSYIVNSHDAWGTAHVGEFATLEQAREVFTALCSDRWFIADGTVKGLSIVESNAAGGRTIEQFSFAES